jgi:hypothetical protein
MCSYEYGVTPVSGIAHKLIFCDDKNRKSKKSKLAKNENAKSKFLKNGNRKNKNQNRKISNFDHEISKKYENGQKFCLSKIDDDFVRWPGKSSRPKTNLSGNSYALPSAYANVRRQHS